MSTASISRWVASTLKKAYSSLSSRDLSLFKIRPHELRVLSASWTYINNVPLSEVLKLFSGGIRPPFPHSISVLLSVNSTIYICWVLL